MHFDPREPETDGAGVIPLSTLVVWGGCAAIAVVGLLSSRRTPPPALSAPAVVTTVAMRVDLPKVQTLAQQAPAPQPVTPLAADTPPQMPQAAPPPEVPALVPLAIPLPAPPVVKASKPADAPPTLAAAARAAPAPSHPSSNVPSKASDSATAAPVAPVVQQLVYGQGEGAQPAPIYPREAALDRQQGVVVVRLDVDADGEVISADAVNKCPWPLLNQAAVRAVRDTWHFAAGSTRTYEVSIRFQLRREY